MGRLWILNLDAELELARPRGYACPVAVERAFAAALPFARALLEAGDREVSLAAVASGAHRGASARAWCPTASVVRACALGGVELADAPGHDVLARVNERGFAAALRDTGDLPGQRWFATDADALERHLSAHGGDWLLKRGHSAAGRGKRAVRASSLDAADRAWIRASFRLGGLQAEPRVAVLAEYALHGRVEEDGSARLFEPRESVLDANGVHAGSRPATDLSAAEHLALVAAARRTADALGAARYVGPFGIDALRWRAEDGVRFRPLSELNARYTLAWAAARDASRVSDS